MDQLDTAEFHVRPDKPERGSDASAHSVSRAQFGAVSHIGKVRTNNEDHYLIIRLGRDQETLMTNLPDGSVPDHFQESGYGMMVADGMGGRASGEVASRIALTTLMHLILHYGRWNIRINEEIAEEVVTRAERFYQEVNEKVIQEASANEKLSGMGTTLTAAYVAGKHLFVVHVGDSRAYLMRQGKLVQLTHDQTFVQMLVDTGNLTKEEASHHHLRHMLTSAIGGSPEAAKVEIRQLELADGDCLLLCTDGLTEMVPEEKIAGVVSSQKDPQQRCEELLQLALDAGGKDNITALLARFQISHLQVLGSQAQG